MVSGEARVLVGGAMRVNANSLAASTGAICCETIEKYGEIHRFVKIALDYRGAHEGDPAIEETIAGFYAQERQMWSDLIKDGIDQGLFKPVDAAGTAQFISTFLDGCMVRSVILPDFDLKSAVGDMHRNMLQLLGAGEPPKARRKRR